MTGPADGWARGYAAARPPARCAPGLLQLMLDLTVMRDPCEILELVVRATPGILGVSAVAVRSDRAGAPGGCDVVCDPDHPDAAWIEATVRTDRSVARAAAARRPVSLITGWTHPPTVATPATGQCRPVLVVPMRSGAGLHGALVLIDRLGAPGFGADDRDAAVALAASLGVILGSAAAHQELIARVRVLDEANAALLHARMGQARYLRSVLHELRTPLQSIVLATQLLDDPAAERIERERLRTLPTTIEDSGRHLLGLIDDLIDVSRAESADLGMRMVDTDIGPILDEVRRLVRPLAAAKGLRLAVARGRGMRAVVDPLRLRQVLLNLLSNAVKFTSPGGRIRVTAASATGRLVIVVRDTGDGMPSEAVERAFEPFERLGRDDVDGAGLGLAIARRIVELHGGTLTARSIPGSGSTFLLRLPVAGAAREDAGEMATMPVTPAGCPSLAGGTQPGPAAMLSVILPAPAG